LGISPTFFVFFSPLENGLENKSEQNAVISEIIPFISQLVSESFKLYLSMQPLFIGIFGQFRGAK